MAPGCLLSLGLWLCVEVAGTWNVIFQINIPPRGLAPGSRQGKGLPSYFTAPGNEPGPLIPLILGSILAQWGSKVYLRALFVGAAGQSLLRRKLNTPLEPFMIQLVYASVR